jgi:uncharacterized protein YifE (UPF0438 family)
MPDENCKVLTPWDISLLNRHLRFYRALHSGEFKPQNVRQENFVRVCLYGDSPRTQHEIAYSRLLGGWQFPPKRVADGVGLVDQSGASAKVERAVDWVETSSIETEQADNAHVLARIAKLYRSGATRLTRASTDVSAWLSVALASDPIAQPITRSLTEHFGDLSNAYTRALDGIWATTGPPPEGWNSFNHRILDGHTWTESLARARAALPDDTILEELGGWITALASDFVTRAGLPITPTSLSADQFENIRYFFVEKLGTPSLWPSDILTLNAVELGGGLLPIIAVVFRWDHATAQEFARLATALGIGSLIAANPAGVVVSLAILATAFDRVRIKGESASSLMTGAASGTVLGGGTMAAAVSVASVAGPIGAIIAAMSAAYALKRIGRSLSELDLQERAAFYITQFKRPLQGGASAAA